jgi:hypothetical protein
MLPSGEPMNNITFLKLDYNDPELLFYPMLSQQEAVPPDVVDIQRSQYIQHHQQQLSFASNKQPFHCYQNPTTTNNSTTSPRTNKTTFISIPPTRTCVISNKKNKKKHNNKEEVTDWKWIHYNDKNHMEHPQQHIKLVTVDNIYKKKERTYDQFVSKMSYIPHH